MTLCAMVKLISVVVIYVFCGISVESCGILRFSGTLHFSHGTHLYYSECIVINL